MNFTNINTLQEPKHIFYVFIHKDKILKVNKNTYFIELNKVKGLLLNKLHINNIDLKVNFLKVTIIKDFDYLVYDLNSKVKQEPINYNYINVFVELYTHNQKYNLSNPYYDAIINHTNNYVKPRPLAAKKEPYKQPINYKIETF